MIYVTTFLVGTFVSWVGLLIVIPIAQKLADFSMPEWSERLWKLAIVAAAGSAISVALDPVNVWLSLIAGGIVFWVLMVKWFQIDIFGALIIMLVTTMVKWIFGAILLGILASAL